MMNSIRFGRRKRNNNNNSNSNNDSQRSTTPTGSNPPTAQLNNLNLSDNEPALTPGAAYLAHRRPRAMTDPEKSDWGVNTDWESYSPTGTVSDSVPASPTEEQRSMNLNLDFDLNLGESLASAIEDITVPENDDDDFADTRSVYSFHSSVDSQTILREVHNRMLPAKCETYLLPVDLAEHQRLDLEHNVLTACAGGLYFAPQIVERILNNRSPHRPMPAIIDIGSGSGTWCIRMAEQFPELEVVGVDLAPPHLSTQDIPPNCRFEIDDANLGFCHYAGCFDMVHSRNTGLGINDYPTYLLELTQMVRPGGILMVAECDFVVYNHEKVPVMSILPPTREGFSWAAYMYNIAMSAMKPHRSTTNAAAQLPGLLERSGEFDSMTFHNFFVPIGSWDGSRIGAEQGATQISAVIETMKSFKPILLSSGYYFASMDEYITLAMRELEHNEVQLYLRWQYVWATRKS